tara:strand:+ start:357 stop:1091 length:735 start_codon:yes stop_codon:yes gene_type:complete
MKTVNREYQGFNRNTGEPISLIIKQNKSNRKMGGQFMFILELVILTLEKASKGVKFFDLQKSRVCDQDCAHLKTCYVSAISLVTDLKQRHKAPLSLPPNFIIRVSKFGDFSILDDELRALVLDLVKLSSDRLTYSNVWRGNDEPHFLYNPLFLASVSSKEDLIEATNKGYNVYSSYSAGAKDMKDLGLKFNTCLTLGDGKDMMYNHKLCSLCTHKCDGTRNIWSMPKEMVLKIREAKDLLRLKK